MKSIRNVFIHHNLLIQWYFNEICLKSVFIPIFIHVFNGNLLQSIYLYLLHIFIIIYMKSICTCIH